MGWNPQKIWDSNKAFYESNPVSATPNLNTANLRFWREGGAGAYKGALAAAIGAEGLAKDTGYQGDPGLLTTACVLHRKLKVEIAPRTEAMVNILPVLAWYQWLCRLTGDPLLIVNGYRHPAYDLWVGGAEDGAHPYNKALDIATPKWSGRQGRRLYMAALYTFDVIKATFKFRGHTPFGQDRAGMAHIAPPIGLGFYSAGGAGSRIHIDLNFIRRKPPVYHPTRTWKKYNITSAREIYKTDNWFDQLSKADPGIPDGITKFTNQIQLRYAA